MRSFDTGATRDSEDGKLDFEGCLSPLTLTRYAQYLNSHRKQADGKIRASDNWQKGIPKDVYVKSAFRHFMDFWSINRGNSAFDSKDGHEISIQEAACAVLFNIMGYLHEDIKSQMSPTPTDSPLTTHSNWSE